MKFITLAANVTLDIGKAPRNTTMALVLTGDFGSGTVTFGTRDKAGSFAEFTDPAPVTVKGNAQVFLGKGTPLVVVLSGATTPDLQIGFAADFFEFAEGIYKFA